MTRFLSAREARKYMEDKGYQVESVKCEHDPWKGGKYFQVKLKRPPGTKLAWQGGGDTAVMWFSDNPVVVEIYTQAEEARRGTNITLV